MDNQRCGEEKWERQIKCLGAKWGGGGQKGWRKVGKNGEAMLGKVKGGQKGVQKGGKIYAKRGGKSGQTRTKSGRTEAKGGAKGRPRWGGEGGLQ